STGRCPSARCAAEASGRGCRGARSAARTPSAATCAETHRQANTGRYTRPVTAGPRLLYPLVFVAGASTMSTEMTASRLLAPFFGASILIWANIIGLILIYLCAGYFIGGRLADRHPAMPYLARLMLIAAAAIALTPFLTRPLLDRAVSAFADASVGAFLGSFFASMLIFSVPITLL